MANAGADIFLILLRPTRVPVVGEAVSHLFQGQVLIESLSWKLHNEDEVRNAEAREDAYSKRKSELSSLNKDSVRARHARQDLQTRRDEARKDMEREQQRATEKMQRDQRDATTDEARDEAYADYTKAWENIARDFKKALNTIDGIANSREEQQERDKSKALDDSRSAEIAAAEEADRNPNFEITFTKRVDIASTQMLNSMKAGDVFPSGTLTIHQRSATVMDGTSLVFTIQRIRLLDYKLKVDVTDTMTEMMEEWTCEFGALAYVYKNPPSHYSHGNTGQAVAKTMSQGTMRAFTMKSVGSPI